MVRREGLEPSHLAAYAPQAYVSTNFTTFAYLRASVMVSVSAQQASDSLVPWEFQELFVLVFAELFL